MTLEAVVLAPALILILSVIIGLGRLALADNTIDQVAHDAARIASIEQDPTLAQASATAQARTSLTAQNIRCQSLSVTVDTAGLATPAGTTNAVVTVDITCTVSLADQFLPFMPGSRTLTATASRAVDAYRERG